ncbi:hypothetical protein [Pseudoduganella aquatica]|uniref:Uncharacterized protein n=1 Tax=Pseudoduganella aquatica TaxID=2660641 RepID=A0A7X4KM17_9BURK|nr:hypothetical protein [Pseudoduganella aquatica]MYN07722.1 hypothetical protein [Pseudoduganella aquatica]
MKNKMSDAERSALLNFLDYFMDEFILNGKSTPDVLPSTGYWAVEKLAPSRAHRGLIMALSDAVEMSLSLSEAKKSAINAKLVQLGGPTLGTLALQYSRRLAAIMKKARLENIEDYYFLKAALDGGHLRDSSVESKAQDILEGFEFGGEIAG